MTGAVVACGSSGPFQPTDRHSERSEESAFDVVVVFAVILNEVKDR